MAKRHIFSIKSSKTGHEVKVEKKLLDMQKSWESVTGKNLYDTDAQDPVGCLKTTLTPAEAEGK